MLQNKVNTAKEVLGNTRSRIVVILLLVIVVVVLIVAYVKFKRSQLPPAGMGSAMIGVPAISSVPGMGNPTREYAKLQEQQNVELAEEAARTGTSAMPTVVRTTYSDVGISSDLSKQSGAASAAGCGVEELKKARASGVSAAELRCRGCSLAALKAAGYTAGELRAAGFSAAELKDAGFSASELKAAGFSAADLKAAGFSAEELAKAGYTAGELRVAGFSAAELKKAGFSAEDLAKAGYTANELKAAGFSAEELQAIGFNDSTAGKCDIKNLQIARGKGVSAAELRKLGCSAAALRAAGYTAAELKAAGFSAAELKNSGFSVADLRAAGFSAAELRAAGFSAADLKAAGFSAADLKAAGFSAGELSNAGFSAAELKEAGFSAAELRAAGFSASDLAAAGFSADELKDAGYTAGDLIRAGIVTGSVGVATVSNCSVESLKKAHKAGTDPAVFKKQGCSASALKEAGYTLDELKKAGFNASELEGAGFAEKKETGFSNKDTELAKLQVESSQTAESEVSGRLTDAQLKDMTGEESANFIKQQQSAMTTQANQLFSVWMLTPTQQFVQGKTEETKEPQAVPEEKPSKEPKVDLRNSNVYKAGSIFFATLDTEVNSDESSPVMATIVQGPLKDSKVIGNFQRTEEKLLVQFKSISVPFLPTSVTINAVAIDPATSKPTIASSVDNHYWLRYGSTLGAAFLSGLGQAVQSSGGQMSATSGAPIVTQSTTSTLGKTIIAVGTMAQTFGTAMNAKINTPPTVKIISGTSVGIMLMADFIVPKKKTVDQ